MFLLSLKRARQPAQTACSPVSPVHGRCTSVVCRSPPDPPWRAFISSISCSICSSLNCRLSMVRRSTGTRFRLPRCRTSRRSPISRSLARVDAKKRPSNRSPPSTHGSIRLKCVLPRLAPHDRYWPSGRVCEVHHQGGPGNVCPEADGTTAANARRAPACDGSQASAATYQEAAPPVLPRRAQSVPMR